MVKKYTLTLDKEFIQYCELNNIKDIDKKAKEVFNRGFTILKYGETPIKCFFCFLVNVLDII